MRQILTIITTYEAQKMTAKSMALHGYGWLIEHLNDTPIRVADNIDWLNSLPPTKKLWHLEELGETAEMSEHRKL
jgi:hypothetical protein